jgi:predicted aspartyl protease
MPKTLGRIGAAVSDVGSKNRTIDVEVWNVDGAQNLVLRCLVDTGADITCIPQEIADYVGICDTDERRWVETASGEHELAIARANLRVADKWFLSHQVLVTPSYQAALGWDILGEPSMSAVLSASLFGEAVHLLAGLPSFKEKTVLVLGQDTTEIHRLRAIQKSLEALGYTGLIVKDVLDLDIQSVEEKVNMLASLCRFVICENSVASGHIDELKICAMNRFVTVILQQDGMGASWMQADYSKDFSFMTTSTYPELDSLQPRVDDAVRWAEAKLEDRRQFFNGLYSWR